MQTIQFDDNLHYVDDYGYGAEAEFSNDYFVLDLSYEYQSLVDEHIYSINPYLSLDINRWDQ